jgi:hypothetical protein
MHLAAVTLRRWLILAAYLAAAWFALMAARVGGACGSIPAMDRYHVGEDRSGFVIKCREAASEGADDGMRCVIAPPLKSS